MYAALKLGVEFGFEGLGLGFGAEQKNEWEAFPGE
jgi:hypothetical protein